MCDKHRRRRVPEWALPAIFLFCAVATVFGLAGGKSRETVNLECHDAYGGNLTSDGHLTVRVEVRRDQFNCGSLGCEVIGAPGVGSFVAESCEETQ